MKRVEAWRPDWLLLACGAILAAGAIAAYSGTFSAPLLFDDIYAIVHNPTIRHWSTAFWPPGYTTATGRPILNLSLAVNYAISGTAVWSYHALNLAIHVLAGLTLFGIVRQALRLRSGQALRLRSGQALRLRSGQALARRTGAEASLIGFGAALLWTLHPLQTESVTYIVQRAESLMGLFYLLTLYCFIRGIDAERADASGPRAGRASWVWFTLSTVACLLGMGTKEVMVSAPLIVLLYDRTFVAGSFREAWRRRWGLHVALAATWLPLAGLVAGAGWNRNGMSGFDVGITPWAYWLTQFEAVARYLWLSVWPHPLVFDYGTFWARLSTEVVLDALVVLGLAVAVLVALWRRPKLGFLGAWFFAILAPTSIMPGRTQMIVEHRMYLPLAAVIVAGVAGLHTVMRTVRDHGQQDHGPQDHGPRDHGPQDHGPRDHGQQDHGPRDNGKRTTDNGTADHGTTDWLPCGLWSCGQWSCGPVVGSPVVFVVLLLALGLGLLTARRNEDYRSELSIWSDTLAKQPDNARAHTNLGVTWSRMPGQLNQAIAQYEVALRLEPDSAEAHNDLGEALSKLPGRLNDAIVHYEEALRLQPDFAEAHTNLGAALSMVPGRLNESVSQHQEALRLQPDSAEAHNNLGLALAQMPGRLDDAVAQFEEALRLEPDKVEAHYNLALARSKMPGRLNDAIAQYEEALRLKPDYAEAHNNLGLAWSQMPGRLDDAIAQYEEALRRKPDFAEAHYNLGNAWIQTPGRLNDAVAQYQEALRLKPDFVQAHNNLGTAFSQMPGRLNDAIAQYEEALRLKLDLADAHYNMAVALLDMPGRGDEAVAHLEAVLRLQPGNGPARQLLARIRASRP